MPIIFIPLLLISKPKTGQALLVATINDLKGDAVIG